MHVLRSVLLFVFFLGGGAALRIWATRRYSQRTGDSFIDSMFGATWNERLWGVPAGVWGVLWAILTLIGMIVVLQ